MSVNRSTQVAEHLNHSHFESIFRCEVNESINKILIKILNHLDYNSLLCMSETNKHLYRIATHVHCDFSIENYDLTSNACKRLCRARELELYGNEPQDHYEYIIIEDAVSASLDKVKIIQFAIFGRTEKDVTPPIHIIFRHKDSSETTIELSEKCKKIIFALSTGENLPYAYNCVDFAMDSLGLYEESKINQIIGRWSYEPIEYTSLKSGNIIGFYKGYKPKHFALYAIDEICLSKLGAGHDCIVPAKWRDLKESYGADSVFKMTLKEAS